MNWCTVSLCCLGYEASQLTSPVVLAFPTDRLNQCPILVICSSLNLASHSWLIARDVYFVMLLGSKNEFSHLDH